MAVIDEAVVNLEKRNMKNLFMTVLDSAYKEAVCLHYFRRILINVV